MDIQPLPCWQRLIREQSLHSDLQKIGMSQFQMDSLRVRDFEFRFIPKDNKRVCAQIKDFIVKYEWLGKMPARPTHRFIAIYKGIIAGVVVMATPCSFSYLLGQDYQNREKLISRGASISWAPKNLASALIMFSIRWMVQNTPYCFFTGYSDTTAGEIGTIYQACNFIYLGKKSGNRSQYFDPQCPELGWFSDRLFRKYGNYRKHAMALGIIWQQEWHDHEKICWNKIPLSIANKIKSSLKSQISRCHRKKIPRKHKYVCILGQNKRETQMVRELFCELNPDKIDLAYPKRFLPINSISKAA